MKACLVADALEPYTGWGRFAAEIARGLIAAGVDCRLLSPREYCAYPELTAHPDHRNLRSFMYQDRHYAKLLIRNYLTLAKAAAGCDLVHAFVEPYLPALGLLPGRVPLVGSLVGSYSLPNVHPLPERLLLRWAMRRCAELVAISSYTARRVRDQLRLDRISVVPLGVDVAEFWPGRPLPVQEEKLLLTVGMLKRRKGLHVTLEAFARVLQKHPTARYAIIGQQESSPYLEGLQALIDKLGIRQSVQILGEVSEAAKIDWYHRCSAFVAHFLSDDRAFDGFGLVFLEANACGKPVIGTRDSGAEEPIIHGENGLLVPQNDIAATAAAIDELFSNPAAARGLGEGGRRRAEQLNWGNTVRKLLQVYERVVGAASR